MKHYEIYLMYRGQQIRSAVVEAENKEAASEMGWAQWNFASRDTGDYAVEAQWCKNYSQWETPE